MRASGRPGQIPVSILAGPVPGSSAGVLARLPSGQGGPCPYCVTSTPAGALGEGERHAPAHADQPIGTWIRCRRLLPPTFGDGPAPSCGGRGIRKYRPIAYRARAWPASHRSVRRWSLSVRSASRPGPFKSRPRRPATWQDCVPPRLSTFPQPRSSTAGQALTSEIYPNYPQLLCTGRYPGWVRGLQADKHMSQRRKPVISRPSAPPGRAGGDRHAHRLLAKGGPGQVFAARDRDLVSDQP